MPQKGVQVKTQAKKSLSVRFSEADFSKQLKVLQEQKNQATALTKSSANSMHMRDVLLLPSLSHRQQDTDELNPGIYTSSYKQRVRELASAVRIQICNDDEFRDVRLETVQPKMSRYNSKNTTQAEVERNLPELDRLIDLHTKYCGHRDAILQVRDKTIEDLQRDLYCLSDDFCRLELYLQTGQKPGIHFWTALEDLVLEKNADLSESHYTDEMNMLLRVKGP